MIWGNKKKIRRKNKLKKISVALLVAGLGMNAEVAKAAFEPGDIAMGWSIGLEASSVTNSAHLGDNGLLTIMTPTASGNKFDVGKNLYNGSQDALASTGFWSSAAGNLKIEQNALVQIGGTYYQAADSSLDVETSSKPNIVADKAELSGTLIADGSIVGVVASTASGVNGSTGVTIIQTVNGITGDFDTKNLISSGEDYVFNGGFVSEDGKNYDLLQRLSWTHGGNQNGTGSFTLGAGETFTVDVELADQTGVFTSGWDGKTLTKDGAGTLVISGKTNWTGNTDIQDGKLILDGSQGEAKLTSNILNSSGSNAELSLVNGARLTGSIDPVSVSVDAVSHWDMTANSIVSDLTNDGTISFLAPTGGVFKTLTVNGDYTGNSGLIILNTQLGTDGSPTDKLIVQGDTSGTANLQINNVGGLGDQTLTDGIEVVDISGASNGIFSLNAPVVAGVYEYKLFKGDLGNTNGNWYLRSFLTQPGNNLIYRPEPGAYMSNQMGAQNLFIHSLHDRLGEPLQNSPIDSKKILSTWVRTVKSKSSQEIWGGRNEIDSNTTVFQFGTEIAKRTGSKGTWHFGVMGGWGQSKSTVSALNNDREAKGEVSGYSGGFYSTWYPKQKLTTQEKNQGAYVDTWVLYGGYQNRVNGAGVSNRNYHSNTLTGSIEAGIPFLLHESQNKSQLFLEPQAQIIYGKYWAQDVKEKDNNSDILIRSGKNDSLTTRLGMRLYKRNAEQTRQAFVGVNWIHQNGNNSIHFGNELIHQGGPTNKYEIKVGMQAALSKRLTVWGQLGYQIGKNDYQQVEGTAGVRYNW